MKRYNLARRVCALTLSFVLLTVDASATIKQVSVWGAKLINDLGDSDYTVSMDTLKDNYSGYLQTDGLTEYFHKDRTTSARLDMTEALGWLIDNNIISRDEVVSVTGLSRVPSVSISKIEARDFLFTHVNRSDALMYIYKAVFGPLAGRAIGVETENIRSDNGYQDTLYNIMLARDYFKTVEEGNTATVIQETATGGKGATGGTHYEHRTPVSYTHSDTGGGGGSGGTAGGQTVTVNTDSQFKWRYTPQGDEYTSIFGDTNIFVSDVDISQSVNTSGGSSSGSHGVGGGGSGGGSNAAITYETDYKQIYYVPGADVLFYNTSDVLEMYLQAILSKGLLKDVFPDTTQKFTETFNPLAVSGASLPSWSGDADPYIVNRYITKKWRVENVTYSQLKDTLGVNYEVRYNGDNMTIQRVNIFNAQSGYFESEYMTRADAYKYIAGMMSAGEKKVSALEADIIAYKYGLTLDWLGSEEDEEAVKFLIAKGILNFDGSDDITGLYSPLTYDDFLNLLYRVANPNARLDFSQVQLTDSETAWKARGFQSQTMAIVGSDDVGSLRIATTVQDTTGEEGAEGDTTGDEDIAGDEDIPDNIIPRSGVPFGLPGTGLYNNIGIAARGELTAQSVHYAPGDGTPSLSEKDEYGGQWGGLVYHTALKSLRMNGINFDTTGLTGSPGAGVSDSSPANGMEAVTEYVSATLDKILKGPDEPQQHSVATLSAPYLTAHDDSNCIHKIKDLATCNFWYILSSKKHSNLLGGHPTGAIAGKISDALSKAEAKRTEAQSIAGGAERANALAFWDAAIMAMNGLKSDIETNMAGTGTYASPMLGNITVYVTADGGTRVGGYDVDLTKMIKPGVSITFDMIVRSGSSETCMYTLYCPDEEIPLEGGVADGSMIAGKTFRVTRKYDGVENAESIKRDFNSVFASNRVSNTIVSGQGLQIQTDPSGSDAFVSWSSLKKAKLDILREKTADGSECDWILSCNGTRAIFSNGTSSVLESGNVSIMATALVGTTVIKSETTGDLGVAYKDENGEVWYHINAVRMLLNANQETVITTARALAVPDSSFSNAVQNYPLVSQSGVEEGFVSSILARISVDATMFTQVNSNLIHYIGQEKWCSFVTMSQASRAKNMVSRKVSYKDASGKDASMFAVLTFTPVSMSAFSTMEVNSSTMLEDILDAPSRAPTSNQEEYNKNKADSNAYCNWIYGTSNATYVETGYLKPTLTLYVYGYASDNVIPSDVLKPLEAYENGDELIQNTDIRSMEQVYDGMVMKRSAVRSSSSTDYIAAKNAPNCQYWVSDDAHVLVTGDRVYVNENAIANLSFISDANRKQGGYYWLKSQVATSASFTVGNTFKTAVTNSPTLTVIQNNGVDVICQVSHVYGLPVKVNGTFHALNILTSPSNSTKLSPDYFSIEGKKSSEMNDMVQKRFYEVFREGSPEYGGVSFEGISDNPYIVGKTAGVPIVKGGKLYIDGLSVADIDAVSSLNNQPDKIYTYLNNRVALKSNIEGGINNCRIYFNVKFRAADYSVSKGVLRRKAATASDFISPSLFVSINDLIIDGLINEKLGGIPINEMEEGALLLVGENYLQCTGVSSGAKEFIGYASLETGTTNATLPAASKGYASHLIKAGNQSMSVAHFFDVFELLDNLSNSKESENVTRSTALSNVVNYTMTLNNVAYTRVYPNGSRGILKGDSSASKAKLYAAVSIKFMDYLLVYKTQEGTADSPARYKILPTAVSKGGESSAVSGALADVPFFSDSVLVIGIAERTGSYNPTNYQPAGSAETLREDLELAFNKVFAKDLITLLRMLLFIILMWLIVASWVCYACRLSNLIPILDAIKHPTGNRQSKGIDLFRLVSLGTIGLDTEFTLGKFLQYNFVLALLMWIVGISGRLPIGGA